MKKHISINFIIGYVVFAAIGFLIISLIIPRMTERHVRSTEASAMYRQATQIATNISYMDFNSEELMSKMSDTLKLTARRDNCEIMAITSKGDIHLDTNGNLTKIPNFDPAISGSGYSFTGNFYGYFSEEHLTVIAPITAKYSVIGYVLIHKKLTDIADDNYMLFNYNYITMLIMMFLFALLLVLYILRICLPVKKLTKTAASFADGDFTARTGVNRADELGELAKSLDYMAGEIEKLNEYQSKFIANVSHDFRSPLTSIKGYLEAMLDGTIPPEMQEKYLNIVLFETDRLNKLTSNLLTMNSINQGVVLDITPFDINSVIRHTIMTFEGTCSQKKITFDITYENKTEWVLGDLGKIQQVIYNLTDNAIKFSNTNSKIEIKTYEKSEKVFISIKDYGIGIPKDSLNKIWDRFYKTDLSRGKDKKGTGLGLSIVKDIVNAHNTSIDVVSTEGCGTEFIFSLPRSKEEAE